MNIELFDDVFDYDYALCSLFRSGEYKKIMDYLNGSDRAISNLMAKDGATIETVAIYLGFKEEYIRERIKLIAKLYDDVFEDIHYKGR